VQLTDGAGRSEGVGGARARGRLATWRRGGLDPAQPRGEGRISFFLFFFFYFYFYFFFSFSLISFFY
jgi:hypothetical protein